MSAAELKEAAMYLEAVAALAKSLAHDAANGRLWEGELSQRIGAIREQLQAAARNAHKDR